MKKNENDDLKKYYNNKADLYLSSYTGEGRYPSNKFRLEIALNLAEKSPGPRILDAGCGNGIFVLNALERGYDCYGFDLSEEMVKRAKTLLSEKGHDPNRVSVGSIFDLQFPDKSFDKVTVLGVLQHVADHKKIFNEIRRVLKKDGDLIASMENSLFSLFTLNKHTVNFLRNVLTHYDIPADLIENGLKKYGKLIGADKAISMKKAIKTSEELNNPGIKLYDYNPLNVHDQLKELGFKVMDIRFYHYHPLPPRFEAEFYELFNTIAHKMEGTEYDWRGAILCNQFVVRAKNGEKAHAQR